MKILALEREVERVDPAKFTAHLKKEEAARVWELVQQDTIRETYFRANRSEAVLVLECQDLDEAGRVLGSLPLVQAGLIRFETIPLVPYPGFARLFAE